MMLERVNYLISVGVRLPGNEMADRLSTILYAAFPWHDRRTGAHRYGVTHVHPRRSANRMSYDITWLPR